MASKRFEWWCPPVAPMEFNIDELLEQGGVHAPLSLASAMTMTSSTTTTLAPSLVTDTVTTSVSDEDMAKLQRRFSKDALDFMNYAVKITRKPKDVSISYYPIL